MNEQESGNEESDFQDNASDCGSRTVGQDQELHQEEEEEYQIDEGTSNLDYESFLAQRAIPSLMKRKIVESLFLMKGFTCSFDEHDHLNDFYDH